MLDSSLGDSFRELSVSEFSTSFSTKSRRRERFFLFFWLPYPFKLFSFWSPVFDQVNIRVLCHFLFSSLSHRVRGRRIFRLFFSFFFFWWGCGVVVLTVFFASERAVFSLPSFFCGGSALRRYFFSPFRRLGEWWFFLFVWPIKPLPSGLKSLCELAPFFSSLVIRRQLRPCVSRALIPFWSQWTDLPFFLLSDSYHSRPFLHPGKERARGCLFEMDWLLLFSALLRGGSASILFFFPWAHVAGGFFSFFSN